MLRVCLVDDDPLVLAGMRRVLRSVSPPITLMLANSGAEALDVLGAQPVDLLLSDLRMPGMDGEELLARVQAEYPQVTRVLCTGALDGNMVFKLQLVAHRALAKPMQLTTLVALMRELDWCYDTAHAGAVLDGPWSLAAASRLQAQCLREQRPHAPQTAEITADVARGNPWLFALLLQSAYGGFVPCGAPLDASSVVEALGPVRLSSLQAHLHALSARVAEGTKLPPSTGEVHAQLDRPLDPTHDDFVLIAREIAVWLEASAEVAESAAILSGAWATLDGGDADRERVQAVAREATRLGVPSAIVLALRASIDDAAIDGPDAGTALRWALALRRDPEALHAFDTATSLAASVPVALRDGWHDRMVASRNVRRSAA